MFFYYFKYIAKIYLISSNSISKSNVEFGPIVLPAPLSPYARSDGMVAFHLEQ